MAINRDDDLDTTTTTTTRSDDLGKTRSYTVPERRAGSGTIWTIILAAAVVLGLIYAFSAWDYGSDGTRTTMTEQPAPTTTETTPPAVQPAPAPDTTGTSGTGTGTTGGTTQPANP